jgi:hypothetical protein
VEEDAFLIDIPDKSSSVSSPLMNPAPQGVLTASQITTYTALQLDSQYCTYVFSILIVGDYARLMQWDQSGAIVTAPIYYQQDPEVMDFFTRFNQAEKLARGHDSSVLKATPAEVRKAIYTNKSFNSLELLVITIDKTNLTYLVIPEWELESAWNVYVRPVDVRNVWR